MVAIGSTADLEFRSHCADSSLSPLGTGRMFQPTQTYVPQCGGVGGCCKKSSVESLCNLGDYNREQDVKEVH